MISTHQAHHRSDSTRAAILLVALVLVALNMRPALASVSPVLGAIQRDLGLGGAAAGLLTTIPTLCMSAFAFALAATIQRLGLERALLIAVVTIGIATLARLGGQSAVVLYASTLGAGLGIALGQALLPTVVERYFSQRSALVTGLYAAGINLGAGLAAGVTVPLQRASDRWTVALAVWAVPAAPAAGCWVWAMRGPARANAADARPGADTLPWRRGRAWFLGLFYGGSSCLYLSVVAWLAPRYQAVGMAESASGYLFAVFTIAQVAGALVVPVLAQRTRDRRPWLAGVLVLNTVGMLGIAVWPLAAPYGLTITIGFGLGGLFALALALPLDYATTPDAVAGLTAMTLGVGYLWATAGPVGIGALHDALRSYQVPFLVLAVITAAMLVGAMVGLKPANT